MFQNIGEMALLVWRTLLALPLTWRQRQKVFDQFFEIGNSSLLMVCLLSFFLGGVLALQAGPEMVKNGLANAVAGLVGVSLAKELAPIMMAILIAGRCGSAMAAEIGSMRVYQEIDALKTMNIDPVNYLVLPRIVAIIVALPMLVMFSVLVSWLGGAAMAAITTKIDIPLQMFFGTMRDYVGIEEVIHGVFKSFFFAWIVGIVSCHQGLITRGGPRGIGRSVTKAVVNSIVLIVLFDFVLTRILLH